MGNGAKYALLVILLFFVNYTYAQRLAAHPFSRDDSAKVNEYKAKIAESMARDDEKTASDWINRMALVYWNHNQFDRAVKYYLESLRINQKLGNENGIAMLNSNLGMIYADQGKYDAAVRCFTITLAARRAKKDKFSLISALNNLSVVLNNLERYDESIEYLEEALDLSRELNNVEMMRTSYGNLSETHEKAGNMEKSHYYFNFYKTFNDEVNKQEIGEIKTKMENQRLKAELESKKKELEILAKKREISKKNELISKADSTNQYLNKNLSKAEMNLKILNQEAQIKDMMAEKQRLQIEKDKRVQRNLLLVGVLLLVVIVVILFAYKKIRSANRTLAVQNQVIRRQQGEILERKEELEKANEEINNKNQEITASINYASMIQLAMLFHRTRLTQLLPESFIFYLPKDIVSGDVYWYRQVGDELVIAAIDCTGHGVPGGFMSMIASNLLMDTVVRRKITSPLHAIKELDKGVQMALNQEDSNNKDGMDLAMCSINIKKKRIRFGGAKNPLILIRDGKETTVKGARFSVGGTFKREKDFEEHTFELGKENIVYLFSDGYQDQFGGPRMKKYSNQRFRKLLMENAHLPLAEQKELFLNEFENWKGDTKQIDDVLIIGAKIVT